MPTTYPLPTLAAQITSTGISAPTFADIYQSLQASFKAIYGVDAYIEPDSQDGEMLAIVAKAINDCNNAAIMAYNNFSPATAQGVGLSNVVKINGIARLVPTNSQVDVLVVGVVGTVITNGKVQDTNGNIWDLPATVTIPIAGQITVTATAEALGAIDAPATTVNQIYTPTVGWQSVTNAAAATPGNPVEPDATLRQRQAQSTMLPSLTALAGIVGAIQELAGVTQVRAYENDTGATDSDGIPGHSIALVVKGGDVNAIANVISIKKTPGAYTYGTTSVDIIDSIGITHTIRFFLPTARRISVAIGLHPLTSGYTSVIGDSVKQAVADYINALLVGDDIERARLYLPAQLYGAAESLTFNITSIEQAAWPGAPTPVDLVMPFNVEATCDVADITLTVT